MKRGLRGDLRNASKYLQGGGQEDGPRLCSVVPSDRTRGNGHKLKQRKLQLNPRKNFFPLRVTEPWPRLPREDVASPSLEIFKSPLAAVLCSLLWVTLLGQGVGLGDPRDPFQPLPCWDSETLRSGYPVPEAASLPSPAPAWRHGDVSQGNHHPPLQTPRRSTREPPLPPPVLPSRSPVPSRHPATHLRSSLTALLRLV